VHLKQAITGIRPRSKAAQEIRNIPDGSMLPLRLPPIDGSGGARVRGLDSRRLPGLEKEVLTVMERLRL
jgi:hypothetical protein